MNYIAIHLFPHEVYDYQRIITQLNKSIKQVDKPDNFKIISYLNTNPSIICEDSYNHPTLSNLINLYLAVSNESKIDVQLLDTNTKILGVNDFRRKILSITNDNDYITFLDCDIHFTLNILKSIEFTINKISKFLKDFVITPTTLRLWDKTWDYIVADQYRKKELYYYKNANIEIEIMNFNHEYKLRPIPTFKWGGGWFTTISAKLAKYINIPNKFVGYGVDDTFIMEGCKHLKKSGTRIQQFVMMDTLVCESIKEENFDIHFLKETNYLKKQSEQCFVSEIEKLKVKIKKTPYI